MLYVVLLTQIFTNQRVHFSVKELYVRHSYAFKTSEI